MKKIITILSVLTFCLVLGLGTVWAAPTLSIRSDYEVVQGGQIAVDVNLINAADAGGLIDGFQFRVSYDPVGLAAANPTSPVPLFSALGNAAISDPPGTVSFGYDGLGVADLGNEVLGSFDVTGLELGTYALTLSDAKLLGSFPGSSIELIPELINGSVTVNAVPIPGSILLLGSGLVGLIGIARRKRS